MSETYADKLNAKKEEMKESAFKKQQKKLTINLSDEERKWAEGTIPLIHNEQFKHYLELENLCILEVMTTAYRPPPETAFKSDKFGENMAFKAGMDWALRRLKNRRESIWHTYLLIKKHEQENPNGEDQKSS